MRSIVCRAISITAVLVLICLTFAGQQPRTGPATEKRFPPLKIPKGFQATLFACDPLIEYPSAIAAGPRAGSIFVAVDFMTGLGTEIVRRDEVRLVEDTDGDGYADTATVYADGFNSIQGLTYHDGTVYVMHAPFLTALRDTNGDGKADERRDLLSGLGLPPEKNPVRLHCANGVVAGHDGWLYLALGDHGADVRRPEGDRLVLKGGGILRCRRSGRDLHVFATGLRNIYDVALDEELNVFVRDNENDGGDYMIRVCHSFFGADHGYPYLYYERPREALTPLADLGRGSSAGGLGYLETAFPAEYRGNLFFCEWGRSVVRYVPERAGSGFGTLKEIEFAAGAANDPYGFKPTDLVVQRDGALFVADWCDGQRPKRGRGRIYRITHPGGARLAPSTVKPGASIATLISALDSESHFVRIEAQTLLERSKADVTGSLRAALTKPSIGPRGRLHAIWALAHVHGQASIPFLLELAKTDPEPRVRAQAVRALADLDDPVLTNHNLAAGRSDSGMAGKLAALAPAQDPRVVLEIVVALGRLRWADAPAWLAKNLVKPDAALEHAAMQTLRQADNWPAVLKLLDQPDTHVSRALALRAVAGRADPMVVDGLIERLHRATDPVRRGEYADALARVHNKPWAEKYWGYRPPPRPANTVAWQRTEAIEMALDRVLGDRDKTVRLAVLRRMQREKIPTRLATLSAWLGQDTDAQRVSALLEALRDHPDDAIRDLLQSVATGKEHAAASRQSALTQLVGGLKEAEEHRLLKLAGALEDGPIRAEAIRHLGKRPRLKAAPFLLDRLKSPEADVRAAAIDALAELREDQAGEPARKLLQDPDARVRAAAATATGKLGVRTATDALVNLAHDTHAPVRRASLDALRRLKEPRVIPLAIASLGDPEIQVTALAAIADLGGPDHAGAVVKLARQNPSADVLPLVVGALSKWASDAPGPKRAALEKDLAELQGASGTLVRWHTAGPIDAGAAAALMKEFAKPPTMLGKPDDATAKWQTAIGAGIEARIRSGPAKGMDTVWLSLSDFIVPEPTPVQILGSSTGPMRVWHNGELVYERAESRAFLADSDRFGATLSKGVNRFLVQVSPAKGNADFHLRFRRKSSTADHEKLVQAALTRNGDKDRGRKVFFDAARSQCIKCHRVGDQGERIGPDLTGIGNRFARVYLIESILEPGRTIAPGYETQMVLLTDGRTLTGTRVSETADALTLGDKEGNKHVLARSNIEQIRAHTISNMPDGLERSLTPDEFVDLIAFLVSQK